MADKIMEMLKDALIETVLFGVTILALSILLPMIPVVGTMLKLPGLEVANLFQWAGLYVAVVVKNLLAGVLEKFL